MQILIKLLRKIVILIGSCGVISCYSSTSYATGTLNLDIIDEGSIVGIQQGLHHLHAASAIALPNQEILVAYYGKNAETLEKLKERIELENEIEKQKTQLQSNYTQEKKSLNDLSEANNNIYISRGQWDKLKECFSWSTPVEILKLDPQFTDFLPNQSYWNPILFEGNGIILLFWKYGEDPKSWIGGAHYSDDLGHNWHPWGRRNGLFSGIIGPTRGQPLIVGKDLILPSSRETIIDDSTHLEIGKGWAQHLSQEPAEWTITPIMMAPETRPAYYRGPIQPILVSGLKGEESKIDLFCRIQIGGNLTRKMAGDQSTYNPLDRLVPLHSATSLDSGMSWSELCPLELQLPLTLIPSGIDALRIDSQQLLIVANFVDKDASTFEENMSKHYGRGELKLVLLSEDKTSWAPVTLLQKGKIIDSLGRLESVFKTSSDDGEPHEYSYPSCTRLENGNILVVYTSKRKSISYKVLEITK